MECLLGIFVYLGVEFIVAECFPCLGSPLLGGVCPCVGVVEVEYEFESRFLDALAQRDYIVEILTGIGIVVGIVGGIDKESHAHGVEFLLPEQVEGRACFALEVKILGILGFVVGEARYIAAHILLCLHSRCHHEHCRKYQFFCFHNYYFLNTETQSHRDIFNSVSL